MIAVRHYAIVTAAYWAFTLTDGALRLVVLLHFHALGYTPIQLAFLFLLYELFGIVTNLAGGWLAARTGLRFTLVAGLALQTGALALLAMLDPAWDMALSTAYVMACQALSGIAKDLTKMSAKSAVKVLVPPGDHSALFTWVAVLTGSKNALKGAGFFLGAALMSWLGFRGALLAMGAGVGVVLLAVLTALPASIGRTKARARFTSVLSHSRAINILSIARLALFAARDVWFVVGVPIFLTGALGWRFMQVGAFLALWVIGYGAIQAAAPAAVRALGGGTAGPRLTGALGLALAALTAAMPLALHAGVPAAPVMLGGLALFGVIFALNSSVHSYLVLAFADADRVALSVGFYYMANAAGRLLGTLLSGFTYQWGGVEAALWTSAALAAIAGAAAFSLPRVTPQVSGRGVDAGGS